MLSSADKLSLSQEVAPGNSEDMTRDAFRLEQREGMEVKSEHELPPRIIKCNIF